VTQLPRGGCTYRTANEQPRLLLLQQVATASKLLPTVHFCTGTSHEPGSTTTSCYCICFCCSCWPYCYRPCFFARPTHSSVHCRLLMYL
jgi:hypothetical protein